MRGLMRNAVSSKPWRITPALLAMVPPRLRSHGATSVIATAAVMAGAAMLTTASCLADAGDSSRPKIILLFDVDGTLTKPRNAADPWMGTFMKDVRRKVYVGFVGGSDLHKIKEQLGANCTEHYDYAFSQNGLHAIKEGKFFAENSLKKTFSNEILNSFISSCLEYIAKLNIPIKRGTFVEFRSGMLNVSPIGRNCSQEERDEFEKYDLEHKIRPKMIEFLKAKYPDLPVTYSIGGQISFDVFPNGWDKTYCLQFLEADGFKEIHFFGDKTAPGGNDFEIFSSPKVIGHTVTSPEDTKRQVEAVLTSKKL
eukprot:TRINITY_DN28789_c0_g1_i1.p3 TRINITY_DN28789_c0_g1~~TRINITY_DN28789_c0_g1_i1.p3  ORF type:complete len:310 (-),score=84.28 TRINITY_DN28789_c0_g1_i1:78-1007(-)